LLKPAIIWQQQIKSDMEFQNDFLQDSVCLNIGWF
jgi:hypothetical protein